MYAFAPVEPGDHDVFVARWPVASARSGQLEAPQWWGNTWTSDPMAAHPVVRGVQTEFSVHHAEDGLLWMISVDGFGQTNIVRRSASAPQGPWSKPAHLHRPAESSRDNILVYSAKAHPELEGGLLITYCTNHLDFSTLVNDMSLYFPRFVRPADTHE